MRRVACLILVVVLTWTGPARAERSDALFAALGLADTLEIMREEGIAYGLEIAPELFPGRGGARWAAMVEQVYDYDRMDRGLRQAFDAALADVDLAPAEEFFGSEQGRRIVTLEVTARRAMLDPDVEAAARTRLDEMILDGDARLAAVRAFVEANDLIEENVVGALNANYAFYAGLAEGGAFPDAPTEAEILRDVWSQEPAIRDDTEEWVFAYLILAYRPLDAADLAAYTAFSETETGQAVNRAMFQAFDTMFVTLSRRLGLAAAQFIAGEDL